MTNEANADGFSNSNKFTALHISTHSHPQLDFYLYGSAQHSYGFLSYTPFQTQRKFAYYIHISRLFLLANLNLDTNNILMNVQ